MRALSAVSGLLALAWGTNAFLVPSTGIFQSRYATQRPSAMTMMAAAGAGGPEGAGCDRRQALHVTGAFALGASALLGRPRLAAADETPAEGFIFPNVSEPAFGSVCFLEFSEAGNDGKKYGRVEVSLYDSVAPKTVENFKALCAGASGVGYKGSNVYRVLKDYSIQAGDIGSKKRGSTGTSSFGEPFPTEKEGLRVRHSLPGMISMAGVGKVDSRFFFNMDYDSAWADDRYVAFGRVTKGMEVLREVEKVDVKTPSNNPAKAIVISDAGVL